MRKKLLSVLLLLIAAGLACNLPTTPQINVEQAVEATLAALRQTAPPPVPPDPGEPVPPTPEGSSVITLATVEPALPTVEQTGNIYQYVTRSGDTLEALALRFQTPAETILYPVPGSPRDFLPEGHTLAIPKTLDTIEAFPPLLPDAEVVYSPAAAGFSVSEWAQAYGGYLNEYTEVVEGETLTGAQVIERVAAETSINPRLLLGFLEYRSRWLTSAVEDNAKKAQPIGFNASGYSGLHGEMTLVARQLTIGYYGWRSGKTLELEFLGGSRMRIDPTLNPGSVALQYLFAKLYAPDAWRAELVNPASFIVFYQSMFGDPWERALAIGPIFPDGIVQPTLELPFQPGERWSLTGGPHLAWGVGSPWGALDFAPISGEAACLPSAWWARASAPGLVVRSGNSMVVLDLEGDGYESTGWALLYMHIARQDRVVVGTYVNVDDPIGHPSCEGGRSTGTHVHLARKYNGEWLAADGPLPMVLSRYWVQGSTKPYTGTLVRDDHIVTAMPDGSRTSVITR